MGTPDFAVPALEKLIASKHEILTCYTQPPRASGRGQKLQNSPIQNLAQKHNISVETPLSLKSIEEQTKFKNLNADIAVVVAYGMLLPKTILDATQYGCINIHPSTLPRWRGAAPIHRTIMAGDAQTSICIMQMDEGLDTGDIIAQIDMALDDKVTSGELHDKLGKEGAELLLATLEKVEQGTITRSKQKKEGVTYAKKISKEEALINWQKSGAEILNQIRALNPYPAAYFVYNDERIKIFSATFTKQKHDYELGKIIDQNLTIVCSNGLLHPTIIQRPGKNKMPVEEAVKGLDL
jgi:methionyl-tRNA formyltransferase